jgi:Tol biopolymer transport system component
MRNPHPGFLALAILASLAVVPVHVRAAPGDTTLISIMADGSEAAGMSETPSISGDGRYVAFVSGASGVVAGYVPRYYDIFIRDRTTARTSLVTVGLSGLRPNGYSFSPVVSADGRYVAFLSGASNLVPNDTNSDHDAFVRDRLLGVTERVSVTSWEGQANQGADLYWLDMSADGRFVAFLSSSSNLRPHETGGVANLYVRDRQLGRTEHVSVDLEGGNSYVGQDFAISGDGRFVAFASGSANLVAGDTNGFGDAFVRDRLTGLTERVSVASDGVQGNATTASVYGISDDGRYVLFESEASTLVPGDTVRSCDGFIRDRWLGTTLRVDARPSGCSYMSLSPDGRYVGFLSAVQDIVPNDTNVMTDTFVHDLVSGTTERVSVSSSGVQGNQDSYRPRFSYDGRYVAFESLATSLVSNDFGRGSDSSFWPMGMDIYLRERGGTVGPTYEFTLKPAIRDFGARPLGSETTLGFWLQNRGVTSLPILQVTLRGEDRAMFRLENRCGAVVPPGEGCGLRVTFEPASPGAKSTRLRLEAGTELRVVEVAGTGVN